MDKPVHVVCFGKDPQLLHTREIVLGREFRTTHVETLVSLLDLSHECAFEIVVLCHSLSQADYDEAVAVLHSYCPKAGIVSLTTGLPAYDHHGSERTLRGLDGPEALLATIRSMVNDARIERTDRATESASKH